MQRIRTILFWLSAAWMCAVPGIGEDRGPLTADEQDAFAWFDGLTYPKLRNAPLVRVSPGTGWTRPDGKTCIPLVDAFLLSDDGTRFCVFALEEREVQTYTRTPPGTPELRQVDYATLDLREEARRALGELQPNRLACYEHCPLVNHFCVDLDAFLLARACAGQEWNDLAHSLCRLVVKGPPDEIGAEWPLRRYLSESFAYSEIWKATALFGEAGVTRADLLARFQALVNNFPATEYWELAREHATILEGMVREDAAHARRAQLLDKLEGPERIAELIFRLRDFPFTGATSASAAPQPLTQAELQPDSALEGIGRLAVPQLIEALDDPRFTRFVTEGNSMCFSQRVYRVSEVAQWVLQRISGICFYGSNNERGDVKRRVQAWWIGIQGKSERDILLEALKSERVFPWDVARRLSKEFPEAALAPIVDAARSAQGIRRQAFVQVAGEFPGDGPVPFLFEELAHGPEREARIRAAWALFQHGRKEALPAMLEEWRNLPEKLGPGPEITDPVEQLVALLVYTRNPEAFEALLDRYRDLPIRIRFEAVDLVGRQARMATGHLSPGETDSPRDQMPDPPLQDSLRAMRDFLVHLFADQEIYEMSGNFQGIRVERPRICDLAAAVLSTAWPEKYRFDLQATRGERNQRLREIWQAWREEGR